MAANRNTVLQKLRFAKRRFADIEAMSAAGTLGSSTDSRQQVVQEFFIHLCGAMEFVAQCVNDKMSCGMSEEEVTTKAVLDTLIKRLDAAHPVVVAMKPLAVRVKKQLLPADPYSAEGLIFRVFNYRNQVVHRHINPFNVRFVVASGRKIVYLTLDPRPLRANTPVVSRYALVKELKAMQRAVRKQCNRVLDAL